jgi:hypothetical protein
MTEEEREILTLVVELLAVDGLSTGTVTAGEVTGLEHDCRREEE